MIEYIKTEPDSDGNGNVTLAIVIYARNIKEHHQVGRGRDFVTHTDNELQVGLLNFISNDVINPHMHHSRTRMVSRTQEVFFVRYGSLTVTLYDPLGYEVNQVTLTSGDVIVLLAGGHALRTYTNSEIVEVKLGPYVSREIDKKDFQPDSFK
jgi:hypothetical protein